MSRHSCYALMALPLVAASAGGQVVTPFLSDAPAYQAISLLGDTLRTFPLSAEVRARYERQLDSALRAYQRAPRNADSIIWLGRRQAYLGNLRAAISTYSYGIDPRGANHGDN